MKRFNKYSALNKLSNRNNSKTKKRTIIISVIVLVIGILYFSFARFESTASFNLISGTVNIQSIPLIDKINELKTNGSTELEYDGTTDNNLRYVGANPNNYVEFNGELWRVIGVMNNIKKEDGTTESLVKIKRAESLGNYSWDSSASSINSGYGINQWGASAGYEGADLMREFNTDYLENTYVGIDGKWYNNSNNSKTADKPTSTINQSSQDMIETVVWNLGSPSNNDGAYDSSFTTNITPSTSYTRERAATNGKTCTSGDYCNDTVTRTSSWTGKVGLIYPSDYGYATSGGTTTSRTTCLTTSMYSWGGSGVSDCKTNSWIYNSTSTEWTLSPRAYSSLADDVFLVSSDGGVYNYYAGYAYAASPVVFLKSAITITGGDGTSEKPYRLKYKQNITDTLASLKSNGATDLEYDGTSTLGEYGTNDNNLRYVGANPSNYIYYNCSTTNPSEMNDSTCEKWRIIGVMNNTENKYGNKSSRVKIVRAESLGNYAWNTSDNSINSGFGVNQWGSSGSYQGSYLMRELNTDYLGNITIGTDGKWYSGEKNEKTANMPTSTLNANAQKMIETINWKIGSNKGFDYLHANELYQAERSSEYTGCGSTNSCGDGVTRTTNWIGKIGLIYPSDYGYATAGGQNKNKSDCLSTNMQEWQDEHSEWVDYDGEECSSNSWLNPIDNENTVGAYWTITPINSFNYGVWYVVNNFGIFEGDYGGGSIGNDIYPSLYLKNNITIVDGNGTSASPYKLKMF